MAKVIIWKIPNHMRSEAVCDAMEAGIKRVGGDKVEVRSSLSYRWPEGDVGFFYGLADKLTRALHEYPTHGRVAINADLGYWGRKDGGRFVGYHKLSVNGRHVTEYFQKRPKPRDRLDQWVGQLRPWRRSGSHILVAGMGPKGSQYEGYAPQGWERRVIEIMRKHTDRPIHYRPKPNFLGAQPIQGAKTVDRMAPLEQQLRGAHALVAHHSNAAIEALQYGVPVFVLEGPALLMGKSRFTEIEEPVYPDGREQWFRDLAYTQWSVAEMASGDAWKYFKEDGLVP